MVLKDYKINGDDIKITKSELEQLREHYWKLSNHHKENRDSFRQAFYIGKHDIIVDILKMFENLEG
jgi:hypothetical protein